MTSRVPTYHIAKAARVADQVAAAMRSRPSEFVFDHTPKTGMVIRLTRDSRTVACVIVHGEAWLLDQVSTEIRARLFGASAKESTS